VRASAGLKAFLMTGGTVFGLVVVAHILRRS
jgi:hypothetical protein